MCGIAGIIGKPEAFFQDDIENMLKNIYHRGPDNQGIELISNAALASSRLRVVDNDDKSNQPFKSNSQRCVLIFNGEVYNYLELAETYNLNLRTKSDTEVIVELYEKLGVDSFSYLEGMYAFCLYDLSSDIAYIHRDPIGIKPLFYYTNKKHFYFASEIKAIINTIEKNFNYNLNSIIDFAALGLLDHSKETFFKDIYSVKPGELIKIKNEKLNISQSLNYLNIAKEAENRTFNDIEEEIINEINHSIDLQSSTVRSLGTHLSGGIDSTLLTLMLSEKNKDINTYTFGYQEEKYDERSKASYTASLLNLKNESSVLTFDDIDSWYLKTLLAHDEPFTSLRQLSHLKLYSDFKEGSTVIFEASGGDEIGAGYRGMIWPLFLDESIEVGFQKAYENLCTRSRERNINEDQARFFAQFALNSSRYGISTSDGTYCSSLKYFVNNKEVIKRFKKSQPQVQPFDTFLQNAQFYELSQTKLPRGLRYIDRSSSFVGREARVPLLTNKIVGLSLALPASRKISLDSSRLFLSEIAQKIYPKINNLKLKKDVADPQRYWIKNQMKELILLVFNSKTFRSRDIFDCDKLIEDFQLNSISDKYFHSLQFFNIFAIEIWLRFYIDKNNIEAIKFSKLSEFIMETNL